MLYNYLKLSLWLDWYTEVRKQIENYIKYMEKGENDGKQD
jgi:hypothetical protein